MANEIFLGRLKEVAAKVKGVAMNAASQRGIFKKGYSFSQLPINEQVLVWNFIWNNALDFWTRIQAFFFYESLMKRPKELVLIWPTIMKWQDMVDNWALSDSLSKIYSKIFEIDPKLVYPVLSDWNKSEDPWKRRQSIVSLLYYSSARKNVLAFIKYIRLIKKLLPDDDYYVQKGVGWTLRELGNVYSVQTYKFLSDNIRSISSIAFSAAVEKLDRARREELKFLRSKKTK